MSVGDPYVVKLVTEDELVFNRGSDDGVVVGDLYEVLDPNTQSILDPKTNKSLGSIDRVLVRVRVTTVGEQIALARQVSRRSGTLSSVSQVLAGSTPAVTLAPVRWPEGVAVGFPMRKASQSAES